MNQLNSIQVKPMALKSLLKLHNVKYWQVAQRCKNSGHHVSESSLSRILNGIEQPNEPIRQILARIGISLRDEK